MDMRSSYLKAVIGPRSELHETRLLIEGEVSHVDLAGRLKNSRRCPENLSGVMKNRLRHGRYTIFAIGAEFTQKLIVSDVQFMFG